MATKKFRATANLTRRAYRGMFLALLLLFNLPGCLGCCTMTAILAREGFSLDAVPAVGPPQQYWHYDDPWDYLSFLMANSTQSWNNDGYGVVAYSAGETHLGAGHSWYKRVKQSSDFGRVWYTGPYPGLSDSSHSSGWDVLDTAAAEIRSGQIQPAIVLGHARSASNHTLGNHPFTFTSQGRTFSFMHNGWCGGARNFMIERVNALDPEWFKRNPSELFRQPDPLQWVDSELLFHYLLCHIAASEYDVMAGLKKGLAGLKYQLEHPQSGVYNFVFCDGARLYLFHNTPTSSGYKLSYKAGKAFYAARTLYPAAGDIELKPLELVVLSRDRDPAHFPDFHLWPDHTGMAQARRDRIDPASLSVSPNPCFGSATIALHGKPGAKVEAWIYDFRGRKVWSSGQAEINMEAAAIVWDGRDEDGTALPAGIYLIRARVGEEFVTGRLVLVK